MKGTILDIQKFALHDGPGIRTTVFLKGCPLNCVWCSNPESIDPWLQLSYNELKCNHCLKCIPVCPVHVFSTDVSKLNVEFNLCNSCGKCITECPENTLKIYGKEVESEDVIRELIKDIDYFRNSGGGLTLSGGDPLFQFDFAMDLFKKTKKAGINTCIETEGYGKKQQFKELLPWVDFFYFDYKLTKPELHKKYTGISNNLILENLDFLCKNNAFVVLRCIIIPEVNDNEEHFLAIAKLSMKYDEIKEIQLMPYHNYGASKYLHTGRKNYFNPESVNRELIPGWIKQIQEMGGRNVRKG
jgi:glycyl-radical enzyme activating protein